MSAECSIYSMRDESGVDVDDVGDNLPARVSVLGHLQTYSSHITAGGRLEADPTEVTVQIIHISLKNYQQP